MSSFFAAFVSCDSLSVIWLGFAPLDATYMYDDVLGQRNGQPTSNPATGVGGSGNSNNGFVGTLGGYNSSHQFAQPPYQRQWYDEPLYANDTDDFLMYGNRLEDDDGGGGGNIAIQQNGRVNFNCRSQRVRNGVISLRSAGDISLPQNGCRPMRSQAAGHMQPQQNGSSKFRGSGDYSGSVSDIQSVTSRMSSVSVSRFFGPSPVICLLIDLI